MNVNENNYEALRQLLKFKNHEVPPPGYFHNFSNQVIARIRADIVESSGARSASGDPWFLKFFQLFEFKPAFAGAFASAVCLMLVFGVVMADRPESMQQPILQAAPPAQASPTFAMVTSESSVPQPAENVGITTTTNPIISLQPVGSMFNPQGVFAQTVNFSVPGK